MSKIEYNSTRINQLDRILKNAGSDIPAMPKKGWISEIRTSLLMTSKQLAKRLGVSQSVVSRLESSEANQTITLNSLNKAASALGCEVKYILVPKTSLNEQLWNQAKKVFAKEDLATRHTMKLEAQEVKENFGLEEDINTAFLLHKKGGKIWNE